MKFSKIATVLIALSILQILFGCNSLSIGSTSKFSIITIKGFSDKGSSVAFDVLIQPIQSNITLGAKYSVVLTSQDNYVFSHQEVSWSKSDFELVPSSERNVGVISQAENKKLRLLTLFAPITDKAISPMRQEYTSLYQAREKQALSQGGISVMTEITTGKQTFDLGKYSITESDYQKIANKYIKVLVMPYEEYLKFNKQ